MLFVFSIYLDKIAVHFNIDHYWTISYDIKKIINGLSVLAKLLISVHPKFELF